MSAEQLIALVILLPLLAAVTAFLWPRRGGGIALFATAVLLAAALQLGAEVLDAGAVTHRVGGWGAPLGIHLRADGLGAFMLLVFAAVALPVSCYARGYFGAPAHTGASSSHFFWPLWLFLIASLNAMALSADIFNLYVTLELMGLAAVALVALAGDAPALRAAMRYLLVSLAGSLFFLMGVAMLYSAYATVDLHLLAQRIAPEPAAWTALALMTGGLMAKGALFPLHFWLPPAHAGAPAPVSAVLSALVVKGAFYLLLRLWFEAYGSVTTPATSQLLGALGAAAILWGSVQALLQVRLKLLIAYSTVAQIGYLFLVFPLAAGATHAATVWTGGMVFLLSHATAKAAMFLAAGNILQTVGHDRIRDLGGAAHALPVSVFAVGLAGISLVGLPPSSGFIGKWLLLGAALELRQWWWVIVILAGSLLTAAYLMRVLMHAFTRDAESKPVVRVSRGMEWSAFVLALLSVALGFFATWPAQLIAETVAIAAGEKGAP